MRLLRAIANRRQASGSAPKARPRNRLFSPRTYALIAVGFVATAAGLAFGLRGEASDDATVSPQLRSLLQTAAGPLIVYRQFDYESDTLWAADPDDPARRIELGQVEHAYGYGITPSLSPDGARIAYAVLPPEQEGLETNAELWLLEVAGGERRKLAEGIDGAVTPVWSPDSGAVAVRRGEWREDTTNTELFRVDVSGGETKLAEAYDHDLHPIDFSPDGAWLYYASVSLDTDLVRVAASGGRSVPLARLDPLAREWRLSPDGQHLAYLAPGPVEGIAAYEVQVLDLATGAVATPLAGRRVSQFAPVWEPAGGLTVGWTDMSTMNTAPLRLTADGAVANAPAAPLPGRAGSSGMDAPISWSPDGVHLAIRAFESGDPVAGGPSRVVVLSTDGRRLELSRSADVVIAGWLEGAP